MIIGIVIHINYVCQLPVILNTENSSYIYFKVGND